jgi:hypothetical protein
VTVLGVASSSRNFQRRGSEYLDYNFVLFMSFVFESVLDCGSEAVGKARYQLAYFNDDLATAVGRAGEHLMRCARFIQPENFANLGL